MGEGWVVILGLVVLGILTALCLWPSRNPRHPPADPRSEAFKGGRERALDAVNAAVWHVRNPPKPGVRFVVGLGVLILIFHAVLLGPGLVDMVRARSWVRVPCTIRSSWAKPFSNDDGRPDTYSFEIRYRYTFDGREYFGDRYRFLNPSNSDEAQKQRVLDRYRPDSQALCWVNPSDPAESVLEKDAPDVLLIGLVPLAGAAVMVLVMVVMIRSGKTMWVWGLGWRNDARARARTRAGAGEGSRHN